MRDWPAYIDLKQKIDDFNETCPLLELMANKAMQGRHWERMSKLCKYVFDVDSETFTLASVMQAPLLKYKDDVEVASDLQHTVSSTCHQHLHVLTGYMYQRGKRARNREQIEANHCRMGHCGFAVLSFQAKRGLAPERCRNS